MPFRGPFPARTTEASSPELALVDDELAARARDLLADPDDTLARLERRIRQARAAQVERPRPAPPSTSSGPPEPPSARVPSATPSTRPRLPRALVVGVAPIAAVLAALLFVFDGGWRSDPAVTPTSGPGRVTESGIAPTAPQDAAPQNGGSTTADDARPPTSAPERSRARPPRRPAATRKPDAREFAWAPVANASGYSIELFRGSTRVYAGRTTRPRMTLPATWTFEGRRHRLVSGVYRWYVWPVISGLRQSQATVQAELTVS
jgi:hypothetical protein